MSKEEQEEQENRGRSGRNGSVLTQSSTISISLMLAVLGFQAYLSDRFGDLETDSAVEAVQIQTLTTQQAAITNRLTNIEQVLRDIPTGADMRTLQELEMIVLKLQREVHELKDTR